MMAEVSLLRLYLLRAMYLIVVVGLGLVIWPGVVQHSGPWDLMKSVVQCMLCAFSLMCLIGLRYPLLMIPALLWELVWKTMWLLVVALPSWKSGQMDARMMGTVTDCIPVILIVFIMPWKYVYHHYVLKAADRFR
jgi:hypothetical protein